jgi:transcriptional regulator with XRE-family HTH domain
VKELKPNNRLQAACVQNMWTLKEAAERVGVDVQTFWRWEHYEQWPHPYSLRRLCAVFAMSAEELGFERWSSKISK